MTIGELRRRLNAVQIENGLDDNARVLLDVGDYLAEIEGIDVDADEESRIIIWRGEERQE